MIVSLGEIELKLRSVSSVNYRYMNANFIINSFIVVKSYIIHLILTKYLM